MKNIKLLAKSTNRKGGDSTCLCIRGRRGGTEATHHAKNLKEKEEAAGAARRRHRASAKKRIEKSAKLSRSREGARQANKRARWGRGKRGKKASSLCLCPRSSLSPASQDSPSSHLPQPQRITGRRRKEGKEGSHGGSLSLLLSSDEKL